MDLARELEKLWNMTVVTGALGSHQSIITKTGGLGNNWKSGDHPN